MLAALGSACGFARLHVAAAPRCERFRSLRAAPREVAADLGSAAELAHRSCHRRSRPGPAWSRGALWRADRRAAPRCHGDRARRPGACRAGPKAPACVGHGLGAGHGERDHSPRRLVRPDGRRPQSHRTTCPGRHRRRGPADHGADAGRSARAGERSRQWRLVGRCCRNSVRPHGRNLEAPRACDGFTGDGVSSRS